MEAPTLTPPAHPAPLAPLVLNLAPISVPARPAVVPASAPSWFNRKWQVFVLLLILAGGAFLRAHRSGTLEESYDAALYEHYLKVEIVFGPSRYPDIVEYYIESQQKMQNAILPPTRFLYLYTSYLWHKAFGTDPLDSLRGVSCTWGVLMLVLAATFAWRTMGPNYSLGVTALMATSPVLIHMSEHAFIDGFFAFWAMLVLWSLWECLRSPDHPGWQTLYTVAGALLVLTKENAFFVFVGVAGLLALNWKLGFGKTTPRLLLLTVAGPLLGGVTLLFLAGGVENLVHVYRLLVAKASVLDYAIRTGDGPWYRYLVDLLTVSPLILLLVVGAVYRLRWQDKSALYCFGFIVCTYLIMCNVKYGMNLRYSTIWELPMRFLAFGQLAVCAGAVGGRRHAPWMVVAGVVGLCAYDLHQWRVFFVEHRLLELVSEELLHSVKIIKIAGEK